MGACGCITGSGNGARFAGPDGSWYVIEMYGGCEYCLEMPGVQLNHYKPGDSMWGQILELPVIEPGVLYLLPIADIDDAKEQIKQAYGEDSNECMFVEDELIPFLRVCASKMDGKWRKRLRGGGKDEPR